MLAKQALRESNADRSMFCDALQDCETEALYAAPAPPAPPCRAAAIPQSGQFNRKAEEKGKSGRDKAGDDLAAFRVRARELLERCRRPESGDLLTRLGILAEQLAALIDDLRSVGIAESRYQPLVQLLTDLRQALPAAEKLDQLWSQSEAILQAFSDGSATDGGRRESFWKFWK